MKERLASGETIIKKILQKKQIRMSLLAAAGVLLLLLSWPTGNTKKQDDGQKSEVVTENEDATDSQSYVQELEARLSTLLSKIEGAGHVEVMITLRTSAEQILQEDVNASENTLHETAANSSRNESSRSRNSSTFTGENGAPYVIKEVTPEVEGVVVAADGASSSRICQEITEAVQALFNIEAHKIKVLKRQS